MCIYIYIYKYIYINIYIYIYIIIIHGRTNFSCSGSAGVVILRSPQAEILDELKMLTKLDSLCLDEQDDPSPMRQTYDNIPQKLNSDNQHCETKESLYDKKQPHGAYKLSQDKGHVLRSGLSHQLDKQSATDSKNLIPDVICETINFKELHNYGDNIPLEDLAKCEFDTSLAAQVESDITNKEQCNTSVAAEIESNMSNKEQTETLLDNPLNFLKGRENYEKRGTTASKKLSSDRTSACAAKCDFDSTYSVEKNRTKMMGTSVSLSTEQKTLSSSVIIERLKSILFEWKTIKTVEFISNSIHDNILDSCNLSHGVSAEAELSGKHKPFDEEEKQKEREYGLQVKEFFGEKVELTEKSNSTDLVSRLYV